MNSFEEWWLFLIDETRTMSSEEVARLFYECGRGDAAKELAGIEDDAVDEAIKDAMKQVFRSREV